MQGIEPLFQELRMAKIWPHLPERGVLVDFGCDFEQTLIKRLRSRMDKVIGLDIVVKSKRQGNMELIKTDLTKKTSLKNSVADVVTMLAVLEHLPNPEMSVKEAYRLLKPGGVFLVTVPAAKSESILPTLARFGIVRQDSKIAGWLMAASFFLASGVWWLVTGFGGDEVLAMVNSRPSFSFWR
jgi:SAM-dependent methyltransferase